MSAQNITTTDELVETMATLVSQGVANLTEYARLLPALYADAPWENKSDIADFTRNKFGIGPSKDGYVTLPQIALDVAIEAFMANGTKLTYAEIIALTGVGRATAARASARGGMSKDQPQKNPNKGNSDNTGNASDGDNSGNSGTPETPEFDLSALLSALDDSELKSVLATVGLDRVRKVIA